MILKLTMSDGKTTYVSVDKISRFYEKDGHTYLVYDKGSFTHVKETCEEILAMLDGYMRVPCL